MDRDCGSCGYYAMTSLHGPWCSTHRKEVSPLKEHNKCWTDPSDMPDENGGMTKVCSKCGRELPVSEFGRHSRTKDGYQPCCKECLSKQNSGHRKRKPFEHNEAPAKPEEPEAIPDGMKKCSHCGRILPVTEFRKHKGTPDGLQYACKECQVEMTTAAKQKKRAKDKEATEKARHDARVARILSQQPEIINDLTAPSVPTLYGATDEQIVQELLKRGYTGNLIKKTSFIL